MSRLRQLRYQLRDSPDSLHSSPENTPGEDDIESLDLPTETPSTPGTIRFSTLSETIRNRRLSFPFGGQKKDPGPWKEPQSFEVLRAVENKDVMYLMVCEKRSHLGSDLTLLVGSQRSSFSRRNDLVLLRLI